MSTDMETQAVREDFEVRPHEHNGIQVGRIMHVCTECGALGRTRAVVVWGRTPGRRWIDPDVEYPRKQAS